MHHDLKRRFGFQRTIWMEQQVQTQSDLSPRAGVIIPPCKLAISPAIVAQFGPGGLAIRVFHRRTCIRSVGCPRRAPGDGAGAGNRKSIAILLGDDRAPIWRGHDLYWEIIVLDVVSVSEFCARQIKDCCALQRMCRVANESALGTKANCII